MGGIAAFRLGDWRVEPAANTLMRVEEEIRLEPKVMKVLSCLAAHAGEVVSKQELIDEVWRTEFVAANTLTRAIAEIRRALGDDARKPTYIQTIPKRGYRLIGEVLLEAAATPPSLADETFDEPERPVFVARQSELARLDRLLEAALEGRGAVAFVNGEAGTGKTALAGEFCRRTLERHEGLVVTWGACNAATGAGDPYGPWRQVLSQLTGDIEAGTTGGGLGRSQAQRLWAIAPEAGQSIADHGVDLVETLVSGQAMVERMATRATENPGWLEVLRRQAEFRMTVPAAADIRQSALFEQLARVVRQLAGGRPLVVVVEDLHWADSGSADLLFHLGRRLEGSRVMVIGTYRASEVALGRNGGRHPIEAVLHELKREHGDTTVELAQSGRPEFVDALVDSEPNDLGRSFRDALFEKTRGHALFTVELLRAMQERGELVRGEDDAWVEGPDLDWRILPARVEGALQERISRLPDQLHDLLTVAAVEGEEFTAEVVARIAKVPEGDVVKILGRDLERRHRLVAGRGFRQLSESRLSRYRFRHNLFSNYLYEELDEAERAYLHHDVGLALEQLHGEHVGEIAAELAHHFERAGRIDKAVIYLGAAAGRAIAVSAFTEAAAFNRRALDLLRPSLESPEAQQAYIEHLRMLATAVALPNGWTDPQVAVLADELRSRCTAAGDDAGLFWALLMLISHHGNRGDFHRQRPLLQESLDLAEASADPLLVMTAHWLQLYYIFAGEPKRALAHLKTAASMLSPELAEQFFRLNGFDPRPVIPTWIGIAESVLGFLDRGADEFAKALEIADELGSPFSRAFIRGLMGPMLIQFGLPNGLQLSEECIEIATERGFEEIRLYGILGRVYTAAAHGDGTPNENYIDTIEAFGYGMPLPWCLRIRCMLLLADGKPQDALTEVRRLADLMDETGHRLEESSCHRFEGDAAMLLGDNERAERAYLRAIGVASRQQVKPLELMAATALAGLWQEQGRVEEVEKLLRPLCLWFERGPETSMLAPAKAILDRLAG